MSVVLINRVDVGFVRRDEKNDSKAVVCCNRLEFVRGGGPLSAKLGFRQDDDLLEAYRDRVAPICGWYCCHFLTWKTESENSSQAMNGEDPSPLPR